MGGAEQAPNGNVDGDDLVRLQWVAYHLAQGEWAEAHELGWEGKPGDQEAASKAAAVLAKTP